MTAELHFSDPSIDTNVKLYEQFHIRAPRSESLMKMFREGHSRFFF